MPELVVIQAVDAITGNVHPCPVVMVQVSYTCQS